MKKGVVKVSYKGKTVGEVPIEIVENIDELIGDVFTPEYVLRCFNYGNRVFNGDKLRATVMPKKQSAAKVILAALKANPEAFKAKLAELGIDISNL